jgi:hypothetical protein
MAFAPDVPKKIRGKMELGVLPRDEPRRCTPATRSCAGATLRALVDPSRDAARRPAGGDPLA